ncbi:hypothetical protein R83H12_01128 [Fibrobacteria bacterium R8-3-H12]
MLRFFLILLLCALFAACSSDDSGNLKEWFGDQGIATSYHKDHQEIDISLKSYSLGFDSSAYMVSSYAALGNANGIEQSLYFGLNGHKNSISRTWKFRPDTTFYKDIYEGIIPEGQKTMDAMFYWLEENETEDDSLWLEFKKQLPNSERVQIIFENDTFYVQIPEIESSRDTLRLLACIKPLSSNGILRIAPPSIADIPGLLRVAQKTKISDDCKQCLRAGVRESLDVVFEAVNEIKNKTVVFAQLVLQKSSDNAKSELRHPVPMYVYNESYIVDTAFVKDYGHPNLVFWQGDTLKLQVTKKLRNYVPDSSLSITLRLGNPALNPTSSLFSTISRPAYASYDFSTTFDKAKLRLWYAETD